MLVKIRYNKLPQKKAHALPLRPSTRLRIKTESSIEGMHTTEAQFTKGRTINN